jgi:Tol biopolymer transport system component
LKARLAILTLISWPLAQAGCTSEGLRSCSLDQQPSFDGWHGKMALAYLAPTERTYECVLVLDAEQRSAKAFGWTDIIGFWHGWIALSPDASTIAFSATFDPNEPYRLGTATRDGRDLRAITSPAGRSFDPVWAPDGGSIVYVGDPQDRSSFAVQRVGPDGGGGSVLPVSSVSRVGLSPDGQRIAFVEGGIALAGIDGQGRLQLTTTPTGAAQYGPWWSPDGRSIVYVEGRAPDSRTDPPPYTYDLRVVGADGTGDRLVYRISMQSWWGDVFPIWSPDGSQIAVNDGTGIIIVDATGDNPRTVLGPLRLGAGAPSWVP